ncbi:MAG TPA: TonB-dependent receptor [Rhodothermales bacterium]|nr:TonB-dependent receptor [Rhodothermales bacterium]
MKFVALRLVRCLGIFVFCLAARDARAQSASLSGFATDRTTGQPLELVSISLRGTGGATRTTVSGRDGAYTMPGLTPGRYVLQATYIGYAAYTDSLELAPGERQLQDIRLEPTETRLGEAVVESERTNGAARVTAGQQVIRPADVELIPAPDLSADLINYLTTVPGVVSTGDRGGLLYVRGGEPSQNLVLLDGMPIYQPFHILGFYSSFPAEIMNRADLYAGGFGARFGGRISSVLDVVSRNGNEYAYAGTATASPFMSSATLEGPIVRGQFSFLASARASVIEQAAEPLLHENLPFSFGDAFVKLQGRLHARGRIEIMGLNTYDRGTVGEDTGGQPPDQFRWRNQAVGVRYIVLPKSLPVTAVARASYSLLRSEQGPKDQPYRISNVRSVTTAIEGTFVSRRMTMDAGWIIQANTLHDELGGTFQGLELRESDFLSSAMYVEPEIDLGAGFNIRPGIRMQFYHVRFDPYLEPRLRVVWKHGVHQVSAAAGVYHQEIVGISDRRDAASVFTVWAGVPTADEAPKDVRSGRLSKAVHTILGYQVSPTKWLDLSIEGFHKEMGNLFVPEWTPFPRLTTRVQPARGRSSGFDVRVEFRPGPFYGYVTYGYAQTIYQAEQANLIYWYGVESMRYRPPHDRRHQVNALLTTTLAGVDLSVRWAFGSGLPFSRALGFDGFVLLDDVMDLSKAPTSRRVIYERPYNGLLPTYHRLDLSIERTINLRPVQLTLQGSLINVYDRRNIFYLDVFTLQRVDQLPIIPSFGIKLAF